MAQRTGGGYRGRGRPGPYRKDRPKQWRQNLPGPGVDEGAGDDQLRLQEERIVEEMPGENISPFKPTLGGSQDMVLVSEAENGPPGEGGPTPKKEKKFSNKARLFVGNLPRDMTDADLRKLFEPFGEVHEVFLQKEKSFGFVRMVRQWRCALFRTCPFF